MSAAPTIEPSARIGGVFLIRPRRFHDARGSFYESYRRSWLPVGAREMVQGNCSFSCAGVLRGLHYHLKQADLWSVVAGRMRAALYDFRSSSPTWGASEILEMGGESPFALYIPQGVAHGFYAVEDTTMTYLVDEYHDGSDELGIHWNDPALAIDWRLPAAPIVSERDLRNPSLADVPQELRPH